MIQLDVSNAELVTLFHKDDDKKVIVFVYISFTDCPDVVFKVKETDMILIFDDRLIIKDKEGEVLEQ